MMRNTAIVLLLIFGSSCYNHLDVSSGQTKITVQLQQMEKELEEMDKKIALPGLDPAEAIELRHNKELLKTRIARLKLRLDSTQNKSSH